MILLMQKAGKRLTADDIADLVVDYQFDKEGPCPLCGQDGSHEENFEETAEFSGQWCVVCMRRITCFNITLKPS